MGNRFREFPSPLEFGRTTTRTPVVRAGLPADFTDVAEDIPVDGDGVPRPRPPVDEEEERERARERERRRRERRGAFGGRGEPLRPVGDF